MLPLPELELKPVTEDEIMELGAASSDIVVEEKARNRQCILCPLIGQGEGLGRGKSQ